MSEIYRYSAISDPLGVDGTSAYGINDAGQVVGTYLDASGVAHGFLDTNGVYATLDVPAASGTEAYGINNSGQVVGSYQDGSGNTHGFLYSSGVYTPLDDPSAPTFTIAYGINDAGLIVGYYGTIQSDPAHPPTTANYGFLYNAGAYTTINPDIVTGVDKLDVSARGINNTGQIVGYFGYQEGHQFIITVGSQAFLDDAGTYTALDVPGRNGNVSFPSTAYGINNAGQIVGEAGDQAFVDTGGTYVFLARLSNHPIAYNSYNGAAGTFAYDISNAGIVAGTYFDDSGRPNGFSR